MKKAWLGLGGNIGDVETALRMALKRLDDLDSTAVTQVSALYKTPPWGVTDQPWFLNCCAEVETTLTPFDLLKACQQVEREGKRERIVRWGPRTIDVDVLAYEGILQEDEALILPHPRIQERAFVLVPLGDIAPNLLIAGKTVSDWEERIEKDGLEKAKPVGWL